MTPEQWHRVKEIFGDALEREPAARESFVREAARGDSDLLREVFRLLKENERDSDLLSGPALADARPLSQPEAPRLAPSALLARRFRIVRFIARGGMGEVYEAEDLELGERVALKVIRQRVASDPDLRALFKREIQLARRVTHPNVCRIFDLAQHEDPESGQPTLLLSMELIGGQTLAEYLRLNGPLTARGALPLIEEIAAGLQAVHNAGVIHGDLKPGNVMLVTAAGETAPHARVMDFGMALPMAQGSEPARDASENEPGPVITLGAANSAPATTATSVGAFASGSPDHILALRGGTPEYLAPEQTKGAPASTATDVYALALVIGEMLGASRSNRFRPDAEHMPSRWARILRRCLAEDPARRYARPAEMAAALRASLDGRARSKRMAVIAACAVVGLLIAARRIDTLRGTANRLLLTETSGLTVQAPSPDGKFLAATSWDTGDLILREIDSGRTRRLTHKSTTWASQFGGTYGALFSPDGRQIACQWANSRTDNEIRLIGIDGKGERTLYHQPNSYISLVDWSPDGRQILVRSDESGRAQQLALLSVGDGSVRFFDPQPSVAWGGSVLFGIDSRSVVFDARSGRGDDHEIRRMPWGGAESTLVSHTGSSSIAGWAPGRGRLIFTSDRSGQPGLWSVFVSDRGAEGEARELLPEAKKWEPLGISRAGALFYRHDASSVDVYTAVVDLGAGRTLSPPQRVTERWVGSFAYPNWSEDGEALVFDSNRDRSTPRLGIYERKTGRMRELPLDLLYSWRPQWVEHGAAIVVVGKARDGREGQFRIDPRTGAVTFLRSGKDLESMGEGVWSRDGKIHFNRYQDFRRGIFRLNVETGERRVLYVPAPGEDVGTENLALSPDGRMLAFHLRKQGRTGTLMLMPPEGGEARPLLTVNSPEGFWYGSFTWTPDSRRILAARTRRLGRSPADEMVSEIWQVPVDGSPATKLDFPAMFVQSLRLNPDGKTLAFQVRHWRSEIWVLQNFL